MTTTSTRGRVLVVDDERDLAESCAFFLRRAGFETQTAFSGEDALKSLDETRYELVVTDIKMPRMSGLSLLEEIKRRDPDVEVVMVTGFPEVDTAVAAMRQGALDYLTKPYSERVLLERVEKAFTHRQLRARNQSLNERLRVGAEGRRLIYRSAAFDATVQTLARAARTDASVLIQGESGTGKELLAHHLHDQSARAGRPFVPVDCTTMPENLIESELFGHVRGAFSGATGEKMGLFQVADGGTLFLDEVGELPLQFQTKLLRAIQERQVRRVGGTDLVAVDVRIVCATNRNLPRIVEEGLFREDLFYRLDVVRVDVPPLRERPEDVELLAEHFLAEFRAKNPAAPVERLADDVRAALTAYHWPGNVRQLRNAIERACTLGSGSTMELADLPPDVAAGSGGPDGDAADPDRETAFLAAASPRPAGDAGDESFQELKARKVAAFESTYLTALLRKHGGNVTRSAEEAGMSRSALQKLMQRYGIRSSDFRTPS